jgi:hypothetical protein
MALRASVRVHRVRNPCLSALLLAGLAACCTPTHLNSDAGNSLDDAGNSSFVMSCPSPIGSVDTLVSYEMTASEEPAAPGDTVTYVLTPPDTVGNAPVPTTFISSASTYAIPAGLTINSATLAATSTTNYTSVTVQLDAGSMLLTTEGSFPVNGSIYPVPAVTIVAQITADAGQTITWEPPVLVVGQASAELVGTQTSTCQIENPSPICVTNVVAK